MCKPIASDGPGNPKVPEPDGFNACNQFRAYVYPAVYPEAFYFR